MDAPTLPHPAARPWIDAALEQWRANPSGARCFLLRGEPGSGKTILARRFVAAGQVHAAHFCQSGQGGSLDPVEFCRDMASQLTRSLPDFARYVVEQEPIRILVRQSAGRVTEGRMIGVLINQFIVRTPSADEAFQALLRGPLTAYAHEHPGQDVFLLIDGLDESESGDRRRTISDLLGQAHDLPAEIRWIVTARPGARPLHLTTHTLDLEGNQPENLAAARAWLKDELRDLPSLLRSEHAVEMLLKHSGGNFLYLACVLADWKQSIRAGRPLPAPSKLPSGLAEYYDLFLRNHADLRGVNARRVMGALLEAREPLSAELWLSLSGLKAGILEPVRNALRPLLRIENGCHSFFHASLEDFLRASSYWINPIDARQRAIKALKKAWPYASALGDYALRHLPAHLHAAGDTQTLIKLLSNPAYIEARLKRGALHTLLDDLRLAKASWNGPLAELQPLDNLDDLLRNHGFAVHAQPSLLLPALSAQMLRESNDSSLKTLWKLWMKAAAPEKAWLRPSRIIGRDLEQPTGKEEIGVTAVAASRSGGTILWGRSDGKLVAFDLAAGHKRPMLGRPEPVFACAVAPDGSWGISTTVNGLLQGWNLQDDSLRFTFDLAPASLSRPLIMPDGKHFAAFSSTGQAWVWDGNTGLLLTETRMESGGTALISSEDGETLWLGMSNGCIAAWKWQHEEAPRVWAAHRGSVTGLACWPDSPHELVSAGEDGRIRVWSIPKCTPQLELAGHKEAIRGLAALPKAGAFLSHSANRIRLWDIGQPHALRNWPKPERPATHLAIVARSSALTAVTAGWDGNVCLRELESGSEQYLALPAEKVSGVPEKGPQISALAFSSDETRLISGDSVGRLSVWNRKTGRQERKLDGHIRTITGILSVGDEILTTSQDSSVKLWRTDGAHRDLAGHLRKVTALAVEARLGLAASGDAQGLVQVQSLDGSRPVLSIQDEGPITALAFFPGGRLCGATGSGSLNLRRFENGEVESRLDLAPLRVVGLAALSGGRMLLLAQDGHESLFKLWEPLTGMLWSLGDSFTGQTALLHAASSEKAIYAAAGKQILAVHPDQGSVEPVFLHEREITSLAVSPGGDQVAIGDTRGEIWMFEWVEPKRASSSLTTPANPG